MRCVAEPGEEVEITRAAKSSEASFDLPGFLGATTAQPLHGGSDAPALRLMRFPSSAESATRPPPPEAHTALCFLEGVGTPDVVSA
jgi:hypothetical protein